MLTYVSREKTILLEDHLFLNKLLFNVSLDPSNIMTQRSNSPLWKSCLEKNGGHSLQGILSSLCVSTCHDILDKNQDSSCNLLSEGTSGRIRFHNPFLYFLFEYDESHTCLRCELYVGRSCIKV